MMRDGDGDETPEMEVGDGAEKGGLSQAFDALFVSHLTVGQKKGAFLGNAEAWDAES